MRRFNAGTSELLRSGPVDDVADEPFWRHLPSAMQEQLLAELRPEEKLMWAGCAKEEPRNVMLWLAVWGMAMVVPSSLLVNMIRGNAGVLFALGWALLTIPFFVPQISRTSRMVFALSSRRALVALRTIHKTVEVQSMLLRQVTGLNMTTRPDGTGDILLTKRDREHGDSTIRFDNVINSREARRTLFYLLPQDVVRDSGLGEMRAEWEHEYPVIPPPGEGRPPWMDTPKSE